MTGGHKVLVHVGTPKTGTSFVQDMLYRNRDSLAGAQILYPAERFDDHFLAALDLMELHWGGLETQAVGAWDRLAARVRAWPGTVIISHEILATASRQQVRRALDSFGDAEVHIVVSARDLVRQIPAEWQENVKHRRTVSYHEFLTRVTDPQRRGELASWFWGVQEVPDILDRWGATLPPDRIHLVTVPKPGAPHNQLWARFATVLGVDAEQFTLTESRSNPSLGVPESALVRRINERVNAGVLANRHYREFVRHLLAHRTLSQRAGSPRLALPPDVRAWAVEVSASWIETLGARGYHVVGDLEDLRPDAEAAPFVDPDAPDETAVSEAAMLAIVALLGNAGRMREEEERLRRELEALRAELHQARGPLGRTGFRIKRTMVRAADHNRAVRVALNAYRSLRGSSSRSA